MAMEQVAWSSEDVTNVMSNLRSSRAVRTQSNRHLSGTTPSRQSSNRTNCNSNALNPTTQYSWFAPNYQQFISRYLLMIWLSSEMTKFSSEKLKPNCPPTSK